MIQRGAGSSAVCIAVLVGLLCPAVSIAGVMRFSMQDTMSLALEYVIGDPQDEALVLTTSSVFQQYAITGTPTAREDGSTFTMTDINVKCLVSIGCHPLEFQLSTEAPDLFNLSVGAAHLHVDGTASTSAPGGIWLNTYFSSGNRSGQGINWLARSLNLTGGSFDADWWSDPSPYFYGPVAWVTVDLTLNGLAFGDSVSLPGSLGADIEPNAAPEPGLGGLLVVGMLALILVGRSQKRGAAAKPAAFPR